MISYSQQVFQQTSGQVIKEFASINIEAVGELGINVLRGLPFVNGFPQDLSLFGLKSIPVTDKAAPRGTISILRIGRLRNIVMKPKMTSVDLQRNITLPMKGNPEICECALLSKAIVTALSSSR